VPFLYHVQADGVGGACGQGTVIGAEAMLDLGNEQDVADQVLRAHAEVMKRPR